MWAKRVVPSFVLEKVVNVAREKDKMSRRRFIKYVGLTAAAAGLAGSTYYLLSRWARGEIGISTATTTKGTSSTAPPTTTSTMATPTTATTTSTTVTTTVAPSDVPPGSAILGVPTETELLEIGRMDIDGVGTFEFNPAEIQTLREDIFTRGHFSVFDVLTHLSNRGRVQMKYHFDSEMNTHVIDELDGQGNWWYSAYYEGGWPERNVFRMDHFPVKDRTTIRILREDDQRLQRRYEVFREETARRTRPDRIVIPEVLIRGPTANLSFENVEVTGHNLRKDTLQPGVITAVDVIMSLAEQGKLTYDLLWRENIIGNLVKNYWVERIDEDEAYGGCGFVYEAGSLKFRGFSGNHIHIPTDIRVLNSPEYVEFFWICL